MVGGTFAPSSITPHCEIIWPSPAKTIASGGSGGTYAVTRRPASYSKVSVTNSPAILIPLSGGVVLSYPCRYRARHQVLEARRQNRAAPGAGGGVPSLTMCHRHLTRPR